MIFPTKKKAKQYQFSKKVQSLKFDCNIGDLVYFHAFADSKDKSTYFLCKGYVTRQPKPESNVYKITVIAVDPKSVLCGDKPEVAKILLGKKIAREPSNCTKKPSDMMRQVYGFNKWLQLSQQSSEKVQKTLQRKQS